MSYVTSIKNPDPLTTLKMLNYKRDLSQRVITPMRCYLNVQRIIVFGYIVVDPWNKMTESS